MYSTPEVRKRAKQTLKKAGERLAAETESNHAGRQKKRIFRKAPKPIHLKNTHTHKNKNNQTNKKPRQNTVMSNYEYETEIRPTLGSNEEGTIITAERTFYKW